MAGGEESKSWQRRKEDMERRRRLDGKEVKNRQRKTAWISWRGRTGRGGKKTEWIG